MCWWYKGGDLPDSILCSHPSADLSLLAPLLAPLQAEISENEEDRRGIQGRIDQLAQSNQNVAFLNLMSTFRLQAVRGGGG